MYLFVSQSQKQISSPSVGMGILLKVGATLPFLYLVYKMLGAIKNRAVSYNEDVSNTISVSLFFEYDNFQVLFCLEECIKTYAQFIQV
jgi:hypothetical protein